MKWPWRLSFACWIYNVASVVAIAVLPSDFPLTHRFTAAVILTGVVAAPMIGLGLLLAANKVRGL